MTDVCDVWIEKSTASLPDPCTPADLVKAGIFHSVQNTSAVRKTYKGPPFLKVAGRIVYPKDGVIEWLKKNKGHVEASH